MPIYTKRSSIKKYTKKQIVGICMTVLFSLLLINLLFGIVKPINTFFLGSFGLLYAITIISLIAVGVLFILEKKASNDYKVETGIGIGLLIVFFLLLHLATVANIPFNGYVKTMTAVYQYQFSMGGVVVSTLLYPLIAFTHKIATMVILLIVLCILTAVMIYRIYLRVTKKVAVKAKKQNTKTEELVKQEIENYEKQEEKIVEAPIEDTIFITDESLKIKEEQTSEKSLAKEILGLSPKTKEQMEKEEKGKEHTTQEEVADSKRPKKIVHRGDIWQEETQSNYVSGKTLTENDRKNLAFLRSIQGKSTQADNQNVDKKDIYDDSLTKDNYKQFVKPKFENPEVKYEQFENDSFVFEKQPTMDSMPEQLVVQSNHDWTSVTKESTISEQTPPPSQKTPYKVSNVLGNYSEDFYTGTKQTTPSQNQSVAFAHETTKQVEPIQEKPKPKPKQPYRYIAPPIDLLNKVESNIDDSNENFEEKATMLEQTLASFDINAKVVSITRGPAFSRFELQMPPGVPVRRVSGFVDDMAMALESHGNIRMEIPIKGRNTFGVEVPNKKIEMVALRDIIDSEQFKAIKSPLAFALGKDITGEAQVTRIDKLRHVMIAGSTGSGKSVCMNSLLLSLLYKASPEDVRLIIIDPKQVEFTPYNGIPHLLIPNVICDVSKAVMALNWAINEMERRYNLFSKEFVRDLGEYNQTEGVRSGVNEKLPYILIIVDELADLMLQNKKEIEESLNRLLAKSRAAGIHLILATQRPSVDVITGTLKNNLPAKIAFKVSSMPDSKTIIGTGGAEKLLGKGDMLFVPEDNPDGHRIQGAFVGGSEINAVVNFVRENNECDFDESIEEAMFNKNGGASGTGARETEYDPLFKDACRSAIIANSVSISKIQRLFGIGYPRAAKIVDQMVAAGYISDRDSNNKYTIFITQQEFEEKFGEDL